MSAFSTAARASRPSPALLAAARGASARAVPDRTAVEAVTASQRMCCSNSSTAHLPVVERAEKESGLRLQLLVRHRQTRGARLRPGQDRFVPLDERQAERSLARFSAFRRRL